MHTDRSTQVPPNLSQRWRALACGALLPLLCATAQAQSVHKCKVDGRVVFQASICPLEPRAAAPAASVPAAQTAVADPSAAPKKKTLADLLRERDAADRARPIHEAQGDGANVLRARMGAV